MNTVIKLIILFSIISLYSCESCEDDIVVADFELTDIAKSFLPESPLDSLIYTNDSIDMTLYTHEGKIMEDDSIYLLNVCQIFYSQQWEIAETEKEYINYYTQAGAHVYQYGVEIRATAIGDHDELTLDSVYIFEDFFLRANDDKDRYLEGWLRIPINDIQRDWAANASLNSRIIEDTILNNKSYTDLIVNTIGNEYFYSKTEGLVAFEYVGDTWYLK